MSEVQTMGELSIFPVLNTQSEDVEGRAYVCLPPIVSRDQLDVFCANDGLHTSRLLLLAWGVLLGTYSANEIVVFDFVDKETSLDGKDPPKQICSIDVAQNEDISCLLRCMTLHKSDQIQQGAQAGTTTLVYGRLQQSPEELVDAGITINCYCDESLLQGSLSYMTSIMSEDQATQVAETFIHITREIMLEKSLSQINYCSHGNLQQLELWNRNIPNLVQSCIHDSILQQCTVHSNAPAVCAWDGEFTYGDIDRLSLPIANHLIRSGTRSDQFIGLYFQKSRWTIIAILAVLRAGGAYVFLDTSFPKERLQDICQKTRAAMVLTASSLQDDASELGLPVLTINEGVTQSLLAFEEIVEQNRPLIQSGNAAYAVFTSGSTGSPKGATVQHSSFCSGHENRSKAFGLHSNSRVMQFSSYAFDLCHQEILAPLMIGACVCIPSEDECRTDLGRAARELRVDQLYLTPTVARLLQPSEFPGLKTLCLVGEAPSSSDIARWMNHCVLLNGYGPAECTIFTTMHNCTTEKHPTIVGRAMSALCWVTDPNDIERLLPPGAIGELIIEGPIVSPGYMNDPERTEESFIKPPKWRRGFAGETERRMYRTGDLVQFVSNGQLKHLGRKDLQVKIRGQRLETSEVEHHIRLALGGDSQVLVEMLVPLDSPTGAEMLVAFVYMPPNGSRRSDQEVEAGMERKLFAEPSEDFRALAEASLTKVQTRLPSYMIPSAIVELNHMPSGKTGKADRKRIREKARQLTRHQLEAYVRRGVSKTPPASRLEMALFQLVSDVLKINDFGMNDNFFHLGGDSVLAMKLSRTARENASLHISAGTIFKYPVLCDLAEELSLGQTKANSRSLSLDQCPSSQERLHKAAQKACDLATREDIEDIYPCTPLQEAMMATSMASTGVTYVIRDVFRISKWIDEHRLRNAWNVVISETPILRTRIFQHNADNAWQVVMKGGTYWNRGDSLECIIEAEFNKKMLPGQPLLRLCWVEEDPDTRYLVMGIHHALCDGWSLRMLLSRVEAAYYGANLPSQPFKDFINHIFRAEKDAAEEYWKQLFEGFSESHFPRRPHGQHSYKPSNIRTHETMLPTYLCTGTNTTLATILEFAWALTLRQFGDSDDIVFGSTVSGRNVPLDGIDLICGPTLATVIRRVTLQPKRSVEDALQDLHNEKAASFEFEHIGLRRISALSKSAATACQFQSLIIIQPWQADDSTSTIFGTKEALYCEEKIDNYILTLEITLLEDGSAHLNAEYDEDVIPGSLMSQILNQFKHNAEQVVNSPKSRLQDIEIVTTRDWGLIQSWNKHVPEAVNCCIHDIIWRHAIGQPNKPAVEAWDGKLTYKELDEIADTLSVQVRAAGYCPGTYVLVHVGKSVLTIVAILAVLKAGASFILVDPIQPIARVRYMCSIAKSNMILTTKETSIVAADLGLKAVVVPMLGTELYPKEETESPNVPAVSPSDVAYAVFTSGSTGQPKGVEIDHRAFLTSAIINGSKQHLHGDSRVLQLASFTFDSSIAEILYTLIHGGCVCVPSEMESRNNLESTLNKYRATWATLTPSMARTLDPSALKTLKNLALGGEAMTQMDIDLWAGHVALSNGYGPAECSVDALVQPLVESTSESNNIGHCFAGAAWIMDPNDYKQLCPIGAVGELVLEGPTLARGYLNSPDQTRASMVTYPKWLTKMRNGKLGRLYKTGDLVKYSSAMDGSICYMGRKDNQAKLRGQRLELAEVEHHLRVTIAGAQGIVCEIATPSDEGAEPLLAAFISFDDVSISSPSESILCTSVPPEWPQVNVASHQIQGRLPNYMCPSVYLPLSGLPLTATGKLDRKLLRDEIKTRTRSELHAYMTPTVDNRPPESMEEILLHKTVSTVLKLPESRISMEDDFFRLGGDSIIAMKLVGGLRELGFHLDMTKVFAHPKLGNLALCLEKDISSTSISVVPPFSLLSKESLSALKHLAAEQCMVQSRLIQDIYPCTPMQEALLASTFKQEESYVATFYLNLAQGIDFDRLVVAWSAVYAACAILRTRFILGLSQEVLQVVINDALQPRASPSHLVVNYGLPLFQLALLKEEKRAVIQIHHSLYDGVSISYIFDQVRAAYAGQTPISNHFNGFVAHITSMDLNESKAFWRNDLKDFTAAAFPSHQSLLTPCLKRSTVLYEAKVEDISSTGFTLSTMIQLAVATVFSKYTASDDVFYGLTLVGRDANIRGMVDVVGPTISTVPFKTRLYFRKTVFDNLVALQKQLLRVSRYEQTGLQTIRQISSDTEAACNFTCHVVLQPCQEDGVSGVFEEVAGEEEQHANFASSPLMLIFEPKNENTALRMIANADTSYLGEEEMRRLLYQVHNILRQLIRDLNVSLGSLETISPYDLAEISAMNHALPPVVDGLVHDLITSNYEAHPDAVAVDSWDGSMTYAKLERFSYELALNLLEKVTPQSNVVVCMEKSCWTIVAIFAVLRAGCGCVMTDPTHPRNRIHDIIRQSRASCVAVSPSTRDIAGGISPMMEVSEKLFDPFNEPTRKGSLPRIKPSDVAFILFTSGSTGKPKGIVLEHRSISTSIRYIRPLFDLDKSTRWLHFSSYGFDMAITEVLCALTSGDCLCIPSELDRAINLLDYINSERIDTVMICPSAARLLQEPSKVPGIRTMLFGGEPLTKVDVSRWAGGLKLINGYGPAECSFQCLFGIPSATHWYSGTLGSAFNSVVWITEPSDPMKLAAWGAIGELLVEGPIIAREYLDDPEKTSISFICDPPWIKQFRSHTAAKTRLYRTGDLVQYTREGQIRYIGRSDSQIKLRGQRIELGEVETQLTQLLPDGVEVIAEVISSNGSVESAMLVAFIHLAGADKWSRDENASKGKASTILYEEPNDDFTRISQQASFGLSSRVPRYMIPIQYFQLKCVPKTPNGKINRRLLTRIICAAGIKGIGSADKANLRKPPPSTQTEKLLSQLWAQILHCDASHISAQDNFLHLGADSIHAIKLVAAARQKDLRLSVAEVFGSPILRDMALLCQHKTGDEANHESTRQFCLLESQCVQSIIETAEEQCGVALNQIEDIYPCTPLQAALISHSMRKVGAYVGTFEFRFPSSLDLPRFQKAWDQVIMDNPILRTRVIQHGSNFQVVIRGEIPWKVVSITDDYVPGLLGGNLQPGQELIELVLAKVPHDSSYEFRLVMHHALYDGWSVDLILNHVATVYSNAQQQTQSVKAFSRFVEHISSFSNKARGYWLDNLANCNATPFPRLPSRNYQPCSDSVVRSTAKISAMDGITNATLIQHCWAIVLSQYTGNLDVVFGLILSGRNAEIEGIDSITGPTTTTVPIRFVLRDGEPIRSELQRLQDGLTQMIPFEQLGLQNIKQLSKDAHSACQFQSLLLIQPKKDTSGDALWADPMEQERDAGSFSAYALEITCELTEEDISILFDYDSNVLQPCEVQRILNLFIHTIHEVQASPNSTMTQLSYLDNMDTKEIRKWNHLLPGPVEKCVHEGISETCLRSPSASAVCAWDGDFTYGELNKLSHALAHRLQQEGVGPEIIVPILAEKTRWVAIAILSVVKAGGAITLLDPLIPLERLRTISQSVDAKLILSTRNCAELARKLAPTVLDMSSIGLDAEGNDNNKPLFNEVTPENALYVIFTSGSTGKPKGVLTEHSAFYTSALTQQKPLRLDVGTRTLQFASHMFDVSIADYLWTFLFGGCVCVASQDMLRNDLKGAIRDLAVNRADLTPSIARTLRSVEIPTLKTLALGGEALTKQDVEMWADKVDLINGYGPSECSVCCVLADVSPQSNPAIIGHAYGIAPWIVDSNDHDKLLPIGAIGELVLEGHTLARGYLGASRANDGAFLTEVPAWLRSLRPNSRLYKTGDLVQYTPSGALQYVGRKDTQVKVRGQRVELGEIEHHVLQADSTIQNAVVELVSLGKGSSNKFLTAFLLHREQAGETEFLTSNCHKSELFIRQTNTQAETCRRAMMILQSVLPTYMVPTMFLSLARLPISPSGKTNRRTLREEMAKFTKEDLLECQMTDGSKRLPATDAEQRIRAVVADVLRLAPEKIGLDDDFFALGGDSIVAIQFTQDAKKAGFSFRVSDVFQHPRLSDLALVVPKSPSYDGNRHKTSQPLNLPTREDLCKSLIHMSNMSVEIVDILPITEASERYLFVSPEYWIVNLRGHIDFERLHMACKALVKRHEVLRSIFTVHNGRYIQAVLQSLKIDITHHETTLTVHEFVDAYRQKDYMPSPTINIPISKFFFVHGKDGQRAVVLRLSHSQFDGYCLHTLWNDLKSLYEGTKLPETIEYGAHLSFWATSQNEESFDFWRTVLAGSKVTRINNSMLVSDVVPAVGRGSFVTVTKPLQVRSLDPTGLTMATIVKTAWACTLAQFTGQREIVFCQVVNGRSNLDMSRNVFGLCLNFVPVRVSLNSSQTGRELMRDVQAQHHQSIQYELVDFRNIVKHSTPWEAGTRHQSLLVHQNIDPDVPFAFGEATAHVSCSYHWEHPPDHILIESRPIDKETLQLTLDTTTGILTKDNATTVLERLCYWITALEALDKKVSFD